jgi:hypothetical protein
MKNKRYHLKGSKLIFVQEAKIQLLEKPWENRKIWQNYQRIMSLLQSFILFEIKQPFFKGILKLILVIFCISWKLAIGSINTRFLSMKLYKWHNSLIILSYLPVFSGFFYNSYVMFFMWLQEFWSTILTFLFFIRY